jgi:hypothetical protein
MKLTLMVTQRMSGVRRDSRWLVGGRLRTFLVRRQIASSSVLTDVPRHVWPPVTPCDQLECFPPARMPGNVTVVECHYLPSNVGSRGNIDFTMEVQYSVSFRPFGRVDGAGGSGFQCFNYLFHGIL